MDSDQAKMIELEDENRRSSQLQLGLGDPTNMQDWPEIYGFEWKTPDMLLEKPPFLLFDCFLNIEFGKAVGVFELLSSEDQVVHLRQFSLVSALLSQCFYASKDSLDALVLPDKTYVFMIQLNDLSMEAEPLRHLHRLCSMDLIRPISQLNLSVQEYVLIKLVACFIPVQRNATNQLAVDTLCCSGSTAMQFCSLGHPISPARIATNEKIKKNCSLIRVSTTLEGHDDQQKTLDDVFQSMDRSVRDLAVTLVLVYNSSEAVKAGFVNEREEPAHRVANEFGRNLGGQGPFAFGQLAKQEADALYPVLLKLAAQYRDTFFADYQRRKEIYLIPIGKLPKSKPGDKQSFVVVVMHKHDQSLSAIAALLLEVN
uniref:NR LBD domain-containing protein n=1 Tax=Ditylenchus dipsaci TaxID=166011 RepID=A0A915DNU7_9BILA